MTKSKQSRNETLTIRQAIDCPETGGDAWSLSCNDSSARFKFPDPVNGDRRATKRLRIELAVRYKVLGAKRKITHVGSGTTLDMSSGGILFSTESALPQGERVEMS